MKLVLYVKSVKEKEIASNVPIKAIMVLDVNHAKIVLEVSAISMELALIKV